MGQGLTTALLVLALGSTGAQPTTRERMSLPDHYLGQRMQPLLLLTRTDVRADIGLQPEQAEQVDQAVLDFVPRAAAIHGIKGPAAVEARRKVDADAQHWLETHLNAKQYQRLIQVDLQWEGPTSLISRPLVADHLDLDAQQRQALMEAVTQRNKQRERGTFNQAIEKALADKAVAVLKPDQLRLWAAMQGRRFNPQFAEPVQTAAPAAQ